MNMKPSRLLIALLVSANAPFADAALPEAPGFGAKLNALHPSLTRTDFTPPGGTALRVTGMDWLSDGRLAICTWDRNGSVYFVSNAEDPERAEYRRFAWGLAEPLGLRVVDGEIFVVQKQELTRLADSDGDGVCDHYECVWNGWDVSANFHEFTFGPVWKDGAFFLGLAVAVNPGGATTNPQAKNRGCVVKIDPLTGNSEVVSAGHRTPNGLALGPDGDLFVTDNQGDWLPGNKLIHVRPGSFNGHRYEPAHPFTAKPMDPPALWLPQNELANSPTEPVLVPGGPYAGQMFFGDIHYGGIQRAALEKVDGQWQGSAHRFTAGLRGGVNRLLVGPDGSLWAGELGVSGNWMEPGRALEGLERLVWNGAPVFDLLAASARANGFVLTFTEPLAMDLGWDAGAFSAMQWRYMPTIDYGGPKMDEETLAVKSASVSADRRSVFLEIDGMREGRVVLLRVLPGFISDAGRPLWAGDAYYTLNRIPAARGEVLPAPAKFTRYVPEKATVDHPGAVVHKTFCISCHSTDGSKLVGPSFRGLIGSKHSVITGAEPREITVDEDYLRKSITHPEVDITEGYQPVMPNFTAALQPGQLDAVIAFIRSLGESAPAATARISPPGSNQP